MTFQLLRSTCELRKGSVVYWNNSLDPQILCRQCGGRGPHGVMVADRKQSYFGSIQFADDLHIRKDGSVARMVKHRTVFNRNDKSNRLSSV